MKQILLTTTSLCSILFYSACGDNMFTPLSSPSVAKKATRKLEQQKPQAAQDILLDKLGSDFRAIYEQLTLSSDLMVVKLDFQKQIAALKLQHKNTNINNLVSILASSKAQMHGVEPFLLALKLSMGSATSLITNSNNLTKLFPFLPPATSSNILGLNVATTLFSAIDSNELTNIDKFKYSLILTANTSLLLKQLDSNSDGVISQTEVTNLSVAMSNTILGYIDSSIVIVSSIVGGEEDSQESSAITSITQIKTQINSQVGADDHQKLSNYVISF